MKVYGVHNTCFGVFKDSLPADTLFINTLESLKEGGKSCLNVVELLVVVFIIIFMLFLLAASSFFPRQHITYLLVW